MKFAHHQAAFTSKRTSAGVSWITFLNFVLVLASCDSKSSVSADPDGAKKRDEAALTQRPLKSERQFSTKQFLKEIAMADSLSTAESFIRDLSDTDLLQSISTLKAIEKRAEGEEIAYHQLLLELAVRDPVALLEMIQNDHGSNIARANETLFQLVIETGDPSKVLPILQKIAEGKGDSSAERSVRESLIASLAYSAKGKEAFPSVIEKMLESRGSDTLISIYFGSLNSEASGALIKYIESVNLSENQKNLALSSIALAQIDKDPNKALSLFMQLDPQLVGSAYGKLFDRWLVADPSRASDALKALNSAQIIAALKSNQFMGTLADRGTSEIITHILESVPLTASNQQSFEKLLASLTKKDRAKAEQIIAELPPSATRNQMVQTFWANSDITTSAAAWTAISDLDPSITTSAANGLMDKLLSVDESAADKFAKSAPEIYQSALSVKLISYINEQSPRDAMDKLISDYNQGYIGGSDLNVAYEILQKSANSSLDTALDMAEAFPDEISAPAYAGLMTVWSKSDPVSASKWLANLPPSSGKDAAVLVLIREIEDTDPETAAKWRSTIK